MSTTDTREALAALQRLMPAIEKGIGGLVFTADKAGEIAADMNTLRAALATQPAQPVHECADNDSPWLVCKKCAAAGQCEKAAQPSAQGEAVAWLVEWKAHGHGPQWWGFNHTPGKNATWCSDANNAIRFARKEDAERMRLHIIAVAGLTGLHEYERSVSVTEHMWEGPCRVD